ncbi:MAG TPA: DNA-binding domain-containing protein [Usitatibacter sp.]|jgi:hypothetical protein|nr:DNA-binding domain-containing protein [Usitatibacter sp.]
MPSLLELQERFAGALDAATPAAVGLDVYRNAITSNYRRALGASFPVVRQLVGGAFFHAAVDAFVAEAPPTSGDLNIYGDRFPAFLGRYEPASALAYLADVARLEWALDECARAGDVASDPREVIAAISVIEDDAIGELRLGLHPSCRLIASRFPVREIWNVHQPGHGSGLGGDLEHAAGDRLLLRRTGERCGIETLGPGEWAWLVALHAGSTFGDALAAALAQAPDFDLGTALQHRVLDGTICDIRV